MKRFCDYIGRIMGNYKRTFGLRRNVLMRVGGISQAAFFLNLCLTLADYFGKKLTILVWFNAMRRVRSNIQIKTTTCFCRTLSVCGEAGMSGTIVLIIGERMKLP